MKLDFFKQKDFSLLMFGKLVSLIGTQMQNFALSLYVLKVTGSATKFASVLAITLLPKLFLGPIAGVFVDWFDRKKIIVYLDMITGIIIGAFALIYKINGGLSLLHIYTLSITLSTISLLFGPAISTVIPTIIKKEKLVDANSVDSFIMNMGNLIAPALAGILFGFYGMFIILVLNSISFILSSISEMFIKIPNVNKRPEKINISSFYNDFSEGISFIKNKKIMLNIIILALMINFVFNPIFSIGLTYISKQILNISDYQYGMLEASLVISMICGSFITKSISKKFKLGEMLFLSVFFSSILISMIALISSSSYLNLFNSNTIPYISIIIVGFMIVLIVSVANIALGTMIQKEIPISMMGRVGAIMSAGCMAAIPLGQMIFGLLFDKIEAWKCVSIGAAILFITILIFKKSLYSNDNAELSLGNEELVVSSPELAAAISE